MPWVHTADITKNILYSFYTGRNSIISRWIVNLTFCLSFVHVCSVCRRTQNIAKKCTSYVQKSWFSFKVTKAKVINRSHTLQMMQICVRKVCLHGNQRTQKLGILWCSKTGTGLSVIIIFKKIKNQVTFFTTCRFCSIFHQFWIWSDNTGVQIWEGVTKLIRY